MKTTITMTTLVAALAFSGAAQSASMDEELKAVCMQDSENTADACGCGVQYVKTHMEADAFAVLHALATTEDGSDARMTKLTALGATPEAMQNAGEKFAALAGDLKTQCNVTVNAAEDEG
jgi:hypothetical protein